MTKKGAGTRDHRSEPDSDGTSEKFRVDRVFAPPRASREAMPAPIRRPSTPPPQVPAGTTPPLQGATPVDSETELSLRRQLSRLQRQLADAQRELANKDEELATAAEKRLELQTAHDSFADRLREMRQQLDEAADFRTRMAGVEQRLQDAIALADERMHQLERERAERTALGQQLDEANTELERARALWRDETALVEEQHTARIAQLEQQKRAAIESAEETMKAALLRQDEALEAEVCALRAAHERSLATLRGELEPKVAEARGLAEAIERLESEQAALRVEQQHMLAERVELHRWELDQQAAVHEAELSERERAHAAEVARMSEQLAEAVQTSVQIERNAALREQLWEQTVAGLRESQKALQQELAGGK